MIDNTSGIIMIQTKQLIIPNYGSTNTNNPIDNCLPCGNHRLTLTNYHTSMYGESLVPVQIGEIVDWNTMIEMWKQLLIYTMTIKRILSNLLTLTECTIIHAYTFDEYKYSVPKLYLFDATLGKNDFESTITNEALFTSCGRETRIKYVKTTNTVLGNSKEYVSPK